MNRFEPLLASDDVEHITVLAGAPHHVGGVVEHGDHRGRTLGFPTANVAIADGQLLPSDGVFAGWAFTAAAGVHPAAVSLGRRPTFYEERGDRLLEVHLIDFDSDLYGQRLDVQFVRLLRPQRRFEGVDELVAQLHRDVDDARTLLGAWTTSARPLP